MKFLARLLKRVLLVCFFFSELAFSETGRAQRSFVYTLCHLISSTSRHEFAFARRLFVKYSELSFRRCHGGAVVFRL